MAELGDDVPEVEPEPEAAVAKPAAVTVESEVIVDLMSDGTVKYRCSGVKSTPELVGLLVMVARQLGG